MKNFVIRFILTFIFTLLCNCDFDNYIGYNYETHELLQTVPIQGYILNMYTHLPVMNAVFIAGNQEALSNKDGYFQIVYIMSEDDQYNKPLDINVKTEKYYDFHEKKIIMPDENEFILYIDRASPVVDQTILYKIDKINEDNTYTYICQAVLTDYQGANSIINVTGHFSYGPGILIPVSSQFKKVKTISATKVYWESKFSLKIENRLIQTYSIYAKDNEGYFEEYDHIGFEFEDYLLF